MKKKILITVVLVLVLACSFCLVGCGDDDAKILSDEEVGVAIDGFIKGINDKSVTFVASATLDVSFQGQNIKVTESLSLKVQDNKIYGKVAFNVPALQADMPAISIMEEFYVTYEKRVAEQVADAELTESERTYIDVTLYLKDGSVWKSTVFEIPYASIIDSQIEGSVEIIEQLLFSEEGLEIASSQILEMLNQYGFVKRGNTFAFNITENEESAVTGNINLTVSQSALSATAKVQTEIMEGANMTILVNVLLTDFGKTTVTLPAATEIENDEFLKIPIVVEIIEMINAI